MGLRWVEQVEKCLSLGAPRIPGHHPDVCVGDGDGEGDEGDGDNGDDDGDCDGTKMTSGVESSCGETSGEGGGEGEDNVKKDCATNGDDH